MSGLSKDWRCPKCGLIPVLFVPISAGGHYCPAYLNRWVAWRSRTTKEGQ